MSKANGLVIHKNALGYMCNSKGTWYAYKNHDLTNSELGKVRYMKCGTGCRYSEAPERLPVGHGDNNEKFTLIGEVDLIHGKVL